MGFIHGFIHGFHTNYGKKKKRIQKSWYYESNIARNILLCEKCSYTTYFLILCAKYLHNPTISVYPLKRLFALF